MRFTPTVILGGAVVGVALGLIVGSLIPTGPQYGVPHSTTVEERPELVPSEDALTNEDALFAQSLAAYVTPADMPDAIALAHDYCAALEDGVAPRDAVDDFLGGLTTDADVIRTARIIGSAVPSYCPDFTGAFEDAAHEMRGDPKLYTA